MNQNNEVDEIFMYHIVSLDGLHNMNFLTSARNSKEALGHLLTNSHDFWNARTDGDLQITIKKIINETDNNE